jgi:hypothetical protein
MWQTLDSVREIQRFAVVSEEKLGVVVHMTPYLSKNLNLKMLLEVCRGQ